MLIRPNQTSFLKERNIIDNIFLTFKMMDWTLKSYQSIIILLLDFKKAYNRVEWSFLEDTITSIDFDKN